MLVKDFLSTTERHARVIVEDNLGHTIFDSATSSYQNYREICGKEVGMIGIHNGTTNADAKGSIVVFTKD